MKHAEVSLLTYLLRIEFRKGPQCYASTVDREFVNPDNLVENPGFRPGVDWID